MADLQVKDSEMEAALEDSMWMNVLIRAVLTFSALFLFSGIRSRKDSYVSHEYVLAMLLFSLSLLIPSELNFPSKNLPKWIFILETSVGSTYYLFIPVSLTGSLWQQMDVLLGEYKKSSGGWSAFRACVLVLTAFTAVMRVSRLVSYFKETW